MILHHVTLHRLRLPLATPFRRASGTEKYREVLLVEAVGDEFFGWGECVAEAEPTYSPEYVESAASVIEKFLLPRVGTQKMRATDLASRFSGIKGHAMAKAGIEAAMLDAECRKFGESFAQRLGATRDRVSAGAAVGMQPTVGELVDSVGAFVAEGYQRVKLKIEPGNDVVPVAAVRKAFPNLALQVDANGSYTTDDAHHLAQLDAFDLLLIEQPLGDDDFLGHAELARHLRTPICLDESITSLRTAELALALGSCRVINIKAGRVGGFLEAVRIHDLCVSRNVPVWCGGMLETGIGRAANLALAALPGFTLTGDLSASSRYFHRDVTEAFTLDDGFLRVPNGIGIGVVPIAERLAEFRTSSRTILIG